MDIVDTLPAEEKKEPWGFNGWLLLLGLGILLSPIRLINNFWTSYAPIIADGTMEDILFNASLGFKSIVIIEIIANIGFLILSVYLIKLFFKKNVIFPKWYLIFAACTMIFLLADTLILSLMFPNIEFLTTDVQTALASCAVALCLWSPYLYQSTRSKNTFIH
ncbi:DUF2569 family protein [Colwellia piezophila]|uniref:DUF2569 family protein n=1 Tax=Colwellia piezophila TaxID=211668 RepID=UPI000376A653|nr:DUF2569 family protein [Colwellia piezophila]